MNLPGLSFRIVWSAAVLVGLIVYSAITPLASEEESASTSSIKKELAKFCTVWSGMYKEPNENREWPMVLEFTPRQGREVWVSLDWPAFVGEPKTKGVGVITPNCISWAILQFQDGQEGQDFTRYIATYTDNHELSGKCLSSSDLIVEATFTLRKVDPQPVQEFNDRNQLILQRLHAAAQKADYWLPAWKKVLTSTQVWLQKTLGEPGKTVDEQLYPDREYATELVESLEKGENYFEAHAGADIPFPLQSRTSNNKEIRGYTVSLPSDFSAQAQYPLLIHLHGAGGGGKIHFKADSDRHDNSFIVVKPVTSLFWKSESLNLILQEVKNLFPIDEDRIYLRGISMGGMGTCIWAASNPEHFAAIAPIAGYAETARAQRLQNIPVWIFQGVKDPVVQLHEAEVLISALEEAGGTVKHTFYPEGKHDIFPIIDYKGMEDWFLEQRRSHNPIPPDPLEELKMEKETTGPKKKVQLPAQRFAALQIQWDESYSKYPSLYEIYRKAGLRPREGIQIYQEPSGDRNTVMLLLPVPQDFEIKDSSTEITIMNAPASQAYVFGIRGDYTRKEDQVIRMFIEELKNKGEHPTGAYRLMNMSTDYQTYESIYQAIVPLKN